MSKKTENENNAKEVVEKVQKNPVKRNRSAGKFGYEYAEPGDNSRALKNALYLRAMPPVDLDSAEEVEERITLYFEHCINYDSKPTVAGMSLALGINRRTLTRWASGAQAQKHQHSAVQAYGVLEELVESYMLNGKINPISGIFMLKNHFGYTDKTEVVLSPDNQLGNTDDPEKIRQRYLAEGTGCNDPEKYLENSKSK